MSTNIVPVRERKARTAWRWVEFSLAAIFATGCIEGLILEPSPNHTDGLADLILGAGAIGFGSLFGLSYIKSPAEQMADSWAKDPSLKGLTPPKPTFTVKPTLGLGSVGFTGTF